MTDNVRSTDGHRNLNCLVVRYPDVNGRTAARFVKDCSLAAGQVLPSPFSDTGKIVVAIFSYANPTPTTRRSSSSVWT